MQAEKYDLATWNMYVRIVSARSLRAASRTEEDERSSKASCTSTQWSVNARPRSVSLTEASEEHSPLSEPEPTDLDQSFDDECYSDTFFELD
jgi:hypothetical protein